MSKIAICALCGKEYVKNSASKICKDTHYRECAVCGKKFKLTGKYLNRKCCSQICANILGKRNREATSLVRYGVANAGGAPEIQAKIRKHSLEKYGVEHPFQAESVKEKIKSTLIDRYGVDNPQKSSIVQQKTANTCVERYGDTCVFGKNSTKRQEIIEHNKEKYGVENLGGLPETVEKIHQTQINRYGRWYLGSDEHISRTNKISMEKYGTMWPSQSEEVKHKIRATNLDRYGVPCVLQSDYIKNKISATVYERYGVPWYCVSESCMANNPFKPSKINIKFGHALQDIGYTVEYEYNVANIMYDIHIIDTNIVIEINPTCSHSTIANGIFKGISDHNYHLNRTKHAKLHGYRCIHIWDWDDVEKIYNLLYKKKHKVFARNLTFKPIVDFSIISEFLSQYHLQGNCYGQTIMYGLFDGDKLVQLMSFGKPRYNKNYEYELLRLCTDSKYIVVGGAERLFTNFVKINNPNSIVSYCDMSKFTGEIYTQLGFTLLSSQCKPSLHWSKGSKHITNNLLNQRGFDQLFNANYGKEFSNEELMIQHKWLPVYDCGQQTYIWRK